MDSLPALAMQCPCIRGLPAGHDCHYGLVLPVNGCLILGVVSATAISHAIDTARRIVYLRINREPTLAEAEEGLLTAFQDPLYQTGFTCLVDRTVAGPPSKEHMYR